MEKLSFLFEEIPWPEPAPVTKSAFWRYTKPRESEGSAIMASNAQNMNKKRTLGFLRAIETVKPTHTHKEIEKDRSYRHMMNERFRRDKQRENYAALHSILPPRTKIDKNSIVKMATLRIQELKGLKDELQKRHCELEKKLLMAREGEKAEAEMARMRLRVGRPSSSIDSMIGVLRCLKGMDLKTWAIRSEFSEDEFSAVLEIESKVGAVQVEQAMASALAEVERKLHSDFPSEM